MRTEGKEQVTLPHKTEAQDGNFQVRLSDPRIEYGLKSTII